MRTYKEKVIGVIEEMIKEARNGDAETSYEQDLLEYKARNYEEALSRIKEIPEDEWISVEQAKAFAEYYKNGILNRDLKGIDVHFTEFFSLPCNPK